MHFNPGSVSNLAWTCSTRPPLRPYNPPVCLVSARGAHPMGTSTYHHPMYPTAFATCFIDTSAQHSRVCLPRRSPHCVLRCFLPFSMCPPQSYVVRVRRIPSCITFQCNAPFLNGYAAGTALFNTFRRQKRVCFIENALSTHAMSHVHILLTRYVTSVDDRLLYLHEIHKSLPEKCV